MVVMLALLSLYIVEMLKFDSAIAFLNLVSIQQRAQCARIIGNEKDSLAIP
jgi:hypothetical protein